MPSACLPAFVVVFTNRPLRGVNVITSRARERHYADTDEGGDQRLGDDHGG